MLPKPDANQPSEEKPTGSSFPPPARRELGVGRGLFTIRSCWLQLQKPPHAPTEASCAAPPFAALASIYQYMFIYILLSLLLFPSISEKMRRSGAFSDAASRPCPPDPPGSLPSQHPCPGLLTSPRGARFPAHFMALRSSCCGFFFLLKTTPPVT